MKENKIDYEQLYYDELYKNKKILQENKELKDKIEILKKYSKNGNIKSLIIEQIKKYKGGINE